MKRSVLFKVFLGHFIIVLLMALFILIVSFSSIRSFHLDSLARNLIHLGESLKFQVTSFLEQNNTIGLDRFVKKFGEQIQTRITVIDREGIVLADSDEDPAKMENHKARPEIYKAYSGEIGQSIRFSRTVKAEMLYIGLPLIRSGEISEVLRVSLYLEDINQLIKGLRWKITQITFLVLFISSILILIMYRSFSKPISELQAASRKVARGDFEKHVFPRYRNEFGKLAESFSFMTEKVKSLFEEVHLKKKELEGILAAIEEGLAALDEDGRILFANTSFLKIVDRESVQGKYYWEVIRAPHLKMILEQKKASGLSSSAELKIEERIYQCNVSFPGSKGETILTLFDISELKEVERIKRDFILNASHELRTPLTSIKGFIETMEEDMDGDNKKYLDIIHRNVDRLIFIVRDLLMMAELEEKEVELEIEKIDLPGMISKVLKIFEQALSQKKLKLEIQISSELPKIEGDAFKLEQMIINLIDNAVKYTEKGTVTISCEQLDDGIIFKIQDTGIGISEEHLSRIFERFYVVDKSRSRGLGGTGLGLSIVKHIVKLHNGEISVESSLGLGTTVSIKLPLQLSLD